MVVSNPASPSTARTGHRLLVLAGFLAAVAVVAGIGAIGVQGAAAEYDGLERPAWAPPSWLFGPVWSALYMMIAVAGWLVWRRAGFGWPLVAYAAQLALNAVWTPLFFGTGAYGLAFADIIALWVLIAVTVVLFRRVSRAAALLLVPYWAWVGYAAALNLAIWQLNR
jgi:translocator protein